jgi:hypothetical protein
MTSILAAFMVVAVVETGLIVWLARKVRILVHGLEEVREQAVHMHTLTQQLHEDNRRLDVAIDARRRT